MEVKDILRAAAAVVDDADIPQDLRAVAYGKAVDLLAGGKVVDLQSGRDAGRQGKTPPAGTGASTDTATKLSRIATKLGVDVATLERIYDATAEPTDLIVHRSKLPADKANATRDVAVLLAVGREATGYEEWTSLAVVRDKCFNMGVLDEGNFAKHLDKLAEDDVVVLRRKGRERELKLTAHGFEETALRLAQINGR